MSKQVDKLKKQLLEISEVVNSFKSDAVQVKVIDKLFDAMAKDNGEGNDELFNQRVSNSTENRNSTSNRRKKPGATKVLNQILSTNFFNTPQSISSIADYCKDNYDSEFKTSELSGILLKLAKENKLRRERNTDNNRFEYVKPL